MSEILFFPWLLIKEPISFGKFGLYPYDKRSEVTNIIDGRLKSILNNYLRCFYVDENRTVYATTLLSINNKFEIEFNESLSNELAFLVELIAFCGLGSRDFFKNGVNYCNKDNFQLKRFSITENQIAYKKITRRRDGATANGISANKFRENKPEHVILSVVNLDKELLNSLVEAQSNLHASIWDNIFEGILNFNLANTDSSSITINIELVFLVSGFERLLNSKHGKEDDLANKFIKAFETFQTIEIKDCVRCNANTLKRFTKCKSVREIWIRDLFRLRGDLAHGKIIKNSTSVWSINEHLVLGSFIFPLVAKILLNKLNVYNLSKNDSLSVDGFESFLCQPSLNNWNDVWGKFLLSKHWEEVLKKDS